MRETKEKKTRRVGAYRLRIEVSGEMTAAAVIDSLRGAVGLMESSVALCSLATGCRLKPQKMRVEHINAGSIDIGGISIEIEDVKQILEIAKDMSWEQILIIALGVNTYYGLKRFFDWKKSLVPQEKATQITTGDISINIGDVRDIEKLKELYPNGGEMIDVMIKALEKSPALQQKVMKSLSISAHPGGMESSGISVGEEREDGEPEMTQLAEASELESVPAKWRPARIGEEEKIEMKEMVLDVVKADCESTADGAIMGRVDDAAGLITKKRLPLDWVSEEIKQKLMASVGRTVSVDLTAVVQTRDDDDPKYIKYIIVKVHN